MSTHQYHRPDLEEADHQANHQALERDLKRILSPSGVVFDIGANRGQFALELLGIYPDVSIISFEPVPAAFAELKQVAAANPRIRPIECAVSAKSGEADLFVTASDVGSSLLKPIPGQPSKWLTADHTAKVQTVRLDEFIERERIQSVSLLKSDAQGLDLEVILSAGRYLKPDFIRAILVELNFKTFYSSQAQVHEILGALTEHGYRLAWLYPHRSHDEWLWWADALFIPND